MNEKRIQELMEFLGVHNVQSGEQWVKCSCPFAWSRHSSGKDQRPSFGITIESTGLSKFNCFSCHSKGTLGTLIVELMHEKGKGNAPSMNLKAAFAMVEQENDESYYDAGEWAPTQKEKQFEAWPEWYLEEFTPAWTVKTSVDYLKSRGMTLQEMKYFDVRFDSQKQRVCFPIRTKDGELAGLRGRSIEKKHFHDYTFNAVNNTSLMWLNEERCDYDRPVIIVEGDFDLVNVNKVYPNVLSALGSQSPPLKLKKLIYFSQIILFMDNDAAGKQAAEGIHKWMRGYVPTFIVAYLFDKNDPGSMTISELRKTLVDYVDLDSE